MPLDWMCLHMLDHFPSMISVLVRLPITPRDTHSSTATSGAVLTHIMLLPVVTVVGTCISHRFVRWRHLHPERWLPIHGIVVLHLLLLW